MLMSVAALQIASAASPHAQAARSTNNQIRFVRSLTPIAIKDTDSHAAPWPPIVPATACRGFTDEWRWQVARFLRDLAQREGPIALLSRTRALLLPIEEKSGFSRRSSFWKGASTDVRKQCGGRYYRSEPSPA